MIGFSNGFFVVISTDKNEIGQVIYAVYQSKTRNMPNNIIINLCLVYRNSFSLVITKTSSVMWLYQQRSIRPHLVETTGTKFLCALEHILSSCTRILY